MITVFPKEVQYVKNRDTITTHYLDAAEKGSNQGLQPDSWGGRYKQIHWMNPKDLQQGLVASCTKVSVCTSVSIQYFKTYTTTYWLKSTRKVTSIFGYSVLWSSCQVFGSAVCLDDEKLICWKQHPAYSTARWWLGDELGLLCHWKPAVCESQDGLFHLSTITLCCMWGSWNLGTIRLSNRSMML